MKRTYVGMKAELLAVQPEGGFLACSVRVSKAVSVEPYHEYFTTENGIDGSMLDNGAFKIGFDE